MVAYDLPSHLLTFSVLSILFSMLFDVFPPAYCVFLVNKAKTSLVCHGCTSFLYVVGVEDSFWGEMRCKAPRIILIIVATLISRNAGSTRLK